MKKTIKDLTGWDWFFLLCLVAGLAEQGRVLASLWGWFVQPMGFPPIGGAQGAGIIILMRVLQWRWTPSNDTFEKLGEKALSSLSAPAAAYVIGHVIYWTMSLRLVWG